MFIKEFSHQSYESKTREISLESQTFFQDGWYFQRDVGRH